MVLRWQRVPRVFGRIEAESLGVVINTLDPYSVEVGEYYIHRRQIPARHVLRVEVPVQARLSAAEFELLKRRIDDHFGPEVQGLALVWSQPYAVACNAITGALALGFDAELCNQTCAKTKISPYFNSPSSAPFKDHGLRPSMLLAGATVAQARQLIDRGVAADHTLGLRGALPVHAYYMATSDRARSVRVPLFPPPGLVASKGVVVHVERNDAPHDLNGLLLMQTGAAQLSGLDSLHWVPGALADHLTSFGGLLDRTDGQTTALAWLTSGATASYGTVSEPCNHLQKFPHPQLLLLHYLQGSSALEAYWKSVAWPQQGVFVGEPLAAPFASR
ncbi:MAG: TIGR03790 family protein [Burkholderiales bacterium]